MSNNRAGHPPGTPAEPPRSPAPAATGNPDCPSPPPRRRPRGEGKLAAAAGRLLTLKDMVQGASTTARTVRFYETQKLIAATERSPGGHRLFAESELGKLRLVLDLRTCGFSLEDIGDILRAKAQFPSVRESAHAIQRILTSHVDELRRKIQVIERLGREFHTTIDVLSRCARCTDPRGPAACQSCDLPATLSVPESFSHIWAVPRNKGGSDPTGGSTA